jgi:hypothetical protein
LKEKIEEKRRRKKKERNEDKKSLSSSFNRKSLNFQRDWLSD